MKSCRPLVACETGIDSEDMAAAKKGWMIGKLAPPDAAWFRATFPERKPLSMDVLNMTRTWLLASGYALQPVERRAAWLKAMYAGVDAGIAACATRPDARFLKTVKAAVDDATEGLH